MQLPTAFALSAALALGGILVPVDDTRAGQTVAPAMPSAAAD